MPELVRRKLGNTGMDTMCAATRSSVENRLRLLKTDYFDAPNSASVSEISTTAVA